jgi:hypothetical protein
MAHIMTQVQGKPIRFPKVPGPGFKAWPVQQRSSAEVDQGIYQAEPRTPETTTRTTFRRWCEEVLRPAQGGSS